MKITEKIEIINNIEKYANNTRKLRNNKNCERKNKRPDRVKKNTKSNNEIKMEKENIEKIGRIREYIIISSKIMGILVCIYFMKNRESYQISWNVLNWL